MIFAATLSQTQLAETLSEINGIYPPLEWEDITERLAKAKNVVYIEGADEIDFRRCVCPFPPMHRLLGVVYRVLWFTICCVSTVVPGLTCCM